MEEEVDKLLLTSLGVTSANPNDIERGILAEAMCNVDNVDQAGASTEEGPSDKSEIIDPSSNKQARLVSKLRAVQFEIDAVASTVEKAWNDGSDKDHCRKDDDDGNAKVAEEEDNGSNTYFDDCTLEQALAADRLRSLKITKAQLETELSQLQHDDTVEGKDSEKLLQNLVKEMPRLKRKSKESLRKSNGKRQRSVSFGDDADFDTILDATSAGFVETERDKLVRKGLLTPFHMLKGYERRLQQPGTSAGHCVSGQNNESDDGASDSIAKAAKSISEASKICLQQPETSAGHCVSGENHESDDDASDSIAKAAKSISKASNIRPSTKLLHPEDLPILDAPTRPFQRFRVPLKTPRSPVSYAGKRKLTERTKQRPLPGQKFRNRVLLEDDVHFWQESENVICEEGPGDSGNIDDIALPFVTLEGGLKIPEDIFNKLFDYQKVGVQWLWELHCQKAGGIIGDEMGLGKTVQVLSFLGALHFSDMYKPSIIICPVTLLRQWKREAKNWYPKFHVELLHDSAQDFPLRKKGARFSDSDCESKDLSDGDYEGTVSTRSSKKWDSLINRVVKSRSGLLITTYEQLRGLGEKLLDVEWGYAVLDEGHRIRNPNAEVTLVCKQLQTIHRIIMTGAPIQNKLTELWSLFDFVFPGKLGVLPVFEAEFSVPISVGGYANATPLQVSTAYRCAVVLRDLIMPYLLRRMKSDVNANLPKKTEHVLFCSLTLEQHSIYRSFLASSEVEQIMDGSRNSLYGIDVMRKICNHPDLLEREQSCQNPDYGNPERSGKMKVVAQVLKVWQEQGHRVLLFAQTQQILDILENFLISSGYCYRRLDGSTAVKQRMALIDEFNNSREVFVFIMTTKVGGLGTNLTGANRVIIYDPDWNPSTDMQARERAWRIGQKRDVTVYRLITRGTIEEKVYHRQIYKHFLTNKILKNPQQKRFFKARDMKDLFTLNDNGEEGSTETSNIFGQLCDDVNVVGSEREKPEKGKAHRGSATRSGDAAVANGNNSVSRSSKKKKKEKASYSDGEVDGEVNGETNILKSLFDAHGIHSAVNHDAIVNVHDEEKMRLEDQASQVAQRAADALRQSRMIRNRDIISVPTWTGKSGAAGAPSLVRQKFGYSVNSRLIKSSGESSSYKASNLNCILAGASAGKALSSSELLARIRGNQQRAVGAGLGQQLCSASSPGSLRLENSGSSGASQNLSGIQPEILIRQIFTFLQRGGFTDSSSIVQHFRDKIPPKDLPLFKNLLKEIATLEKDANGKFWVLKPEFSNNDSLGNE